MKLNFLLTFFLFGFIQVHAQNFTGQWKGGFTDRSTSFSGFGGEECDYILEIECKGSSVSGSSYTYFTDGGKKYYTICKLEGFINTKQKYIEVKEVERTKTNVPVNIRNCFQTHKLTYYKHGDTATLEGKWEPAPGQDGDCGFGTTLLTRRELKQRFPNMNVAAARSVAPKNHPVPLPAKRTPQAETKKAIPLAGTKRTLPVKPSANAASQKPKVLKKDLVPVDSFTQAVAPKPENIIVPNNHFEKRNNTVLETIEVVNRMIKVDLYDNGEVDGDSISLFYNGKLLLSHKRLSEKAITMNINIENEGTNELVMYAENLGTIPPNTALMVVTDGNKRYEVRITSDLQKSGVINFVHKQ